MTSAAAVALAIEKKQPIVEASQSGAPSSESVRAALDKVLASQLFAGSARYTRFLRFAVEETLQSRGGSLKEHVLAVKVFDRKETFNPQEDPIVRVEASRLRARLKKYYETEGRDDAIAVEFPKGTYAPVFQYRPVHLTDYEPQSIAEQMRALVRTHGARPILAVLFTLLATGVVAGWMFWPGPRRAAAVTEAGPASIAVLPFVNDNPDKATDDFSDGLTDELINALAQTKALQVVARTSVFRYKGKMEDVRKIGREVNAATVLEGSVRKAGKRLRITIQLIDVATGYNRWSDTYDSEVQDVFNVQHETSRAIVDAVLAHKGRTTASSRTFAPLD
jgi:adenylate cyclase